MFLPLICIFRLYGPLPSQWRVFVRHLVWLQDRIHNHGNVLWWRVRCGDYCNFEFSTLLHSYSIITKNTTTPCNDNSNDVCICINCIGLQYEYNLRAFISVVSAHTILSKWRRAATIVDWFWTTLANRIGQSSVYVSMVLTFSSSRR